MPPDFPSVPATGGAGPTQSVVMRPMHLVLRLAAALAVLVCLHYLTTMLCLMTSNGLVADCRLTADDQFNLYWRVSGGFSEKVRVGLPVAGGEQRQVKIHLKDEVVRQFRLDLGKKAQVIEIYSLALVSHFGEPRMWNAADIAREFTPNADITAITDKGDHLEITTKDGNPYLLSPKLSPYENIGIAWLLPLVFAALTFVYVPDVVAMVRQWPVFADLRDKGNPGNIAVLDGVRGLAALAVLAEHTGVLPGIGAFGVYLFFALSGFLLARPFARQPERAGDFAYMRLYIMRRLKRILPMYYLFITVTVLLSQIKPEAAIRHYLFLQGDSHLWTLPQEMFFYAILPLVVLGMLALKKLPRIVTALFLLALVFAAASHWGVNIVHFYGYGEHLPSRAGIFLAGVFFACCHDGLGWNQAGRLAKSAGAATALAFATLALLVVLVILSGKLIPAWKGINFLTWPTSYGFLCGLAIFLAALSSQTAPGRLLANPLLRWVGIIGFSFYLVHPWLLGLVKSVALVLPLPQTSWSNFFLTGIATLVVASFTYSFVERPFIHQKRQRPD